MNTRYNIKTNPLYNDQYFLDLYGILDLDEECKPYPRIYRNLIESEKLDAAFHEAGHAAVGILLGYYIPRCQIFPSNSKSILEEKSWVGNCSFSPQSIDEDFAVFSAAGKVAETINDGAWDDVSVLLRHCYDIEDFEDLDLGLSASDLKGISGSANIQETFNKAHSLLVKNWGAVQRVAEALMEQCILTQDDLVEVLGDFHATQKGA